MAVAAANVKASTDQRAADMSKSETQLQGHQEHFDARNGPGVFNISMPRDEMQAAVRCQGGGQGREAGDNRRLAEAERCSRLRWCNTGRIGSAEKNLMAANADNLGQYGSKYSCGRKDPSSLGLTAGGSSTFILCIRSMCLGSSMLRVAKGCVSKRVYNSSKLATRPPVTIDHMYAL